MNATFSCSGYAFGQFTATLFLSCITLVTIIGNGLVIGAILINKKLQNLSNYLVFSLSVTDLTVGIFIMPFRIYEDIYYPNKWEFSGFLCNVVVFIMVTTYLASMLHIFAIAIDRFLMVISIKYMQVRSKMHMYTIIGFAWITALFLTALPFMGLRSEDKFDEYIGQGRCKYDAGIVWYFPLIYWSCFMIPMMIMIPLYVGIYRKSKNRISMVKKSFKLVQSEKVDDSKDTQSTAFTDEVTQSQMQSNEIEAGNKVKMDVKTRDSREKRVATILTVITVAYVICVAPQVIYNSIIRILSTALGIPGIKGPPLMHKLFLWLVICNSMVNPIIYTFFNREFIITFYEMKKKIFACF